MPLVVNATAASLTLTGRLDLISALERGREELSPGGQDTFGRNRSTRLLSALGTTNKWLSLLPFIF